MTENPTGQPGTPVFRRPLHVLIIDADPERGVHLAATLGRCEGQVFQWTLCAAADEALAVLEQALTPVDVLLIDQHLAPGADGIALLPQLLRLSPESSAVVFTEAGDEEAGRRARAAGAYSYLPRPFSTEALLHLLINLSAWRQTRDQLTWFEVINRFAEDAQHLYAARALEGVIVQRGLELGFDRVRLWVSSDGGQTLVATACAGREPLEQFRGLRLRASESPYLMRVVQSRVPVIFRELEHGKTWLMQQRSCRGYAPPAGEWVGLPLRAGDVFRGALMLDRRRATPLRQDQLLQQALILFARQVGAALERTALQTETEILSQIGRLAGADPAERSDQALLEAVRQALSPRIDVENFIVAMRSETSGWIELLLDVSEGVHGERRSLPPGRGMIHQHLVRGRPVLLRTPQEIRAFRQRHGVVRLERRLVARSWLGVPLLVAGRAVGALVLFSTRHAEWFSENDQRFLEAVAAQIAGPLHNRRLREAAELTNRRLILMQQAAAALIAMGDDPQDDDRLWHAALTVITAGYGLCYNLAAYFSLHRGRTLLRGRLAIGQVTLTQARRAWAADEERGQTFEHYLEQLRQGAIRPTVLDGLVRGLEIPVQDGTGALGEAVLNLACVRVPESELTQRFPPQLAACLPPADYEVAPVMVARRRIGIVIVANPHLRRPLDDMPRDLLTTWLAQVALIFETRRQRRAGEQLAEISRAVLARAADRPLRETLEELSRSTRVLMSASCAAILPLEPGSSLRQPRFAARHAAGDGLRDPALLQSAWSPGPEPFITQILEAPGPFAVENAYEPPWTVADDPEPGFVAREWLRSFIAAPILDHLSGDPRGVLVIGYRSQRSIDERDRRLSGSFAELAGQAMRNYDERALLEREQEVFATLLQDTLRLKLDAPDAERVLFTRILQAATRLLNRPDARPGLILRGWQRPDRPGQARAIRQEYFLLDDELKYIQDLDLYRGVTGRAFETGEPQLVHDVNEPPWNTIFFDRFSRETRAELDVLIRLEDQVLGLINVESPQVGAFTSAHCEALKRLANIVALAIDVSQTQRQLRELYKAVAPMIVAGTLRTTLQAVLEQILILAPNLSAVTIWYWDEQRRALAPGVTHGVRHEAHLVEDPHFSEETVLGRVVRRLDPLWAEDARAEPMLDGRFVHEEDVAACVAFPLQIGETPSDDEPVGMPIWLPPFPDGRQRRVIGVLFLVYRQPHRFTRRERVILPIVASVVAACIRDAFHVERLAARQRQLQAATDLARAVLEATLDLDETLRRMLAILRDLIQNEHRRLGLSVLLADETEQHLSFTPASREFYHWEFVVERQIFPIYPPPNGADPQPGTIAARVARKAREQRRAILETVNDVRDDPDYVQANPRTLAQLTMALLNPEHDHSEPRLLGVLVIETDRTNAFSFADEQLIERLAPTISLAIARARENRERRFSESVAAMTAWASQIAHDIDHVISGANNAIYWLTKTAEPEQMMHITRISQSLGEIRRLARASDQPSCEPPYDIGAWLREHVPQIIKRRAGAPVMVTYMLSAEVLLVRANEILLERVMEHLIRNARQARPRDCSIAVTTAREGAFVRITVANDGPSIPPEVQQRLFVEPIRREQRVTEGGRGLLLARSMMKTLGGEMALVSPISPVTFALRLPLAKPDDPQ